MKMHIRELRERAGMTQAALAQRVGYRAASAITMWERGNRKPPSDVLPDLADALGCTIDELYGRGTPGKETA